MIRFRSLSYIFFLFSLFNCVSYDLHPVLMKGTTFYQPLEECECKGKIGRIVISAKMSKDGDIIKERAVFVSEYFFLSFYFGRLLGTYDNGNIEQILKEDIQNIPLNDDESLHIEIGNISYKSNNLFDLLNEFVPGGFFRYYRYHLNFVIKVKKT